MKFKEINVPEGTIRQIDQKGPFAGIMVDAVSMNTERERYLLSTDEMFEEMLS